MDSEIGVTLRACINLYEIQSQLLYLNSVTTWDWLLVMEFDLLPLASSCCVRLSISLANHVATNRFVVCSLLVSLTGDTANLFESAIYMKAACCLHVAWLHFTSPFLYIDPRTASPFSMAEEDITWRYVEPQYLFFCEYPSNQPPQ
jgi:hypothetical protein